MTITELFDRASIPVNVLNDRLAFIKVARAGVSGDAIRFGVSEIDRDLFIRLLELNPAKLSAYYAQKSLTRSVSEAILDTYRLIAEGMAVFDGKQLALEWFNTPLACFSGDKPFDLCDTYEGRRWVREVLSKISQGDLG